MRGSPTTITCKAIAFPEDTRKEILEKARDKRVCFDFVLLADAFKTSESTMRRVCRALGIYSDIQRLRIYARAV